MLRSRLAGMAGAVVLAAGGVGFSLAHTVSAHAAADVCVDTNGNVVLADSGCSQTSGPLSSVVGNGPLSALYFAVDIQVAQPEACDAGDTACISGVGGVSAEANGLGTTSPTGELEVCAAGTCSGIESVPDYD